MCRYDKGKKGWMRNWIGYAMYAELSCELRYKFYIPFTHVSLAFVQRIFLLQISQKKKDGSDGQKSQNNQFQTFGRVPEIDFENFISGFDLSCYIK